MTKPYKMMVVGGHPVFDPAILSCLDCHKVITLMTGGWYLYEDESGVRCYQCHHVRQGCAVIAP